MPTPTPVLFLSHGAPTLALAETPTVRHWRALPERLAAPPAAVLCVSAHWDTPAPRLAGGLERPAIQHDFAGFPEALYRVTWPVRGSAERAARVLDLLNGAGGGEGSAYATTAEPARPLDHGVWVPLRTAWPHGEVPVLQLSVSTARGVPWHLGLGRRLAPLREEGFLIVASGGITHNLRRLDWHAPDGAAAPWAKGFVTAFEAALAEGDLDLLCDPHRLPHGPETHPTVEHYVPLLVALGAAADEPLIPIHRAWTLGALALHSYATPGIKAEALPVAEEGEEEREAA